MDFYILNIIRWYFFMILGMFYEIFKVFNLLILVEYFFLCIFFDLVKEFFWGKFEDEIRDREF